VWEYRFARVKLSSSIRADGSEQTFSQDDRELQRLGRDRWEAVSMIDDGFRNMLVVLLKRHTQEYLDSQRTFGEHLADGLALQDIWEDNQ